MNKTASILLSKKFQIVWAIWTLILGVSLAFVHTFQQVHSFSEYLAAFPNLDMPSSWCPTFLVLFGVSTLVACLLGESILQKVFTAISRFAGLVLLPVGLYATYEFTFADPSKFDFIYLYAQTIHITEVLTGLLTVFLLVKMRKKIIISIIILAFLTVIGAAALFLIARDKDVDLKVGKISSGMAECGKQNEFFTHKPVNFEDIDSIVPLGNLNPSGHTFPTDHIYLNIKEGKTDIPVYAPGDIWVTDLHLSEKYEDGKTTKDYSVDFRPCEQLSAYYIHINTLSDKLQTEFDKNYSEENCDEYTTGGNKFRMCFVEADVKLSAGELVGTTGYPGQRNFDLGANDLRVDTSWVKKYTKRAQWRENILSTVCPLDYFTPTLKTKLYSMVGDTEGVRRTVEPICGTVNQDEWGTAQGVWFLVGASMKERKREDEHAALVHHNVHPTRGMFSIGTSMEKSGLSTGAFNFIPKNSGLVNRDFDQVKSDGKIYCYENGSGVEFGNETIVIIIKLLDESTLRMERLSSTSCGSGPWQFSSNYTEFER